MDDLYQATIVDHYKHPRNFGEVEGATIKVREANASCGDLIEMTIKVKGQRGKLIVEDVKFKGIGCALSTAAASMLTEAVKGKSIETLNQVNQEFMLKLLGVEVTPTRMKCVTLPLKAWDKARKQVQDKLK